jgi:hypothetical protein
MNEKRFVQVVQNYASVVDALDNGVRTSDLDKYDGPIYEQWRTLEDLYDELQTQAGYFEDVLTEQGYD